MSYYRNQTNPPNMGPSSFDYSNNFSNSPLSQNAMLNSTYNNLNLSTRAQQPSNNTNNSVGFYPTPRVSNLSPNLNFASLYSNRARFNASKGFDIEDDLEFCPEINESYSHLHSSPANNNNGNNNNFTHHKFNPYTSSTFSPQVSPTSANASTTSPVPKSASTTVSTPTTSTLGDHSPRVTTPRTKKVLEIINPATGLRVSSPAPYK